MRGNRFVGWMAVISILALPVVASADMKGHGDMAGTGTEHVGMKMDDHGKTGAGGHDMSKMGDKVWSGKIGPWTGDARIMDMKAHLESSGMKVQGAMPNSHHIAVSVTDPKTKSAVAGGTGTVTVTGPDKVQAKAEFMFMQGHFGADVNLPKPGKYAFRVEIESGGQKGSASFSYTRK